MKINRRFFLKASLLGSAAAGFTIATHSVQAQETGNEIVVGKGGDYTNIGDALASITDASESNPYLVRVLPGVYGLNGTLKSWISLQGSGRSATILEGADYEQLIVYGSNITLSDFLIRYSGSQPDHTAINRRSRSSEIIISDIDIEHTGQGAAIRNAGNNPKLTWWLNSLKIRSESIGIDAASYTYCDNLKILLHGTNTGQPHIGVRVAANRARIFMNSCRIGTGYWSGFNGTNFIGNEVRGDDDVIGILSPRGFIKTRIEVHNLESFCRNEDSVDPAVKVNVIRMESGWLRAFSCFGQAETPNDWTLSEALHQSGNGKIEQYACRFTDIDGNSFGNGQLPTQTFSSANHNYLFDKFESGLHRLDTSQGGFTLRLRDNRLNEVPGELHHFKIIRGDLDVTIDLNGATLEGVTENPILSGKYSSLKLVWDGYEWLYG